MTAITHKVRVQHFAIKCESPVCTGKQIIEAQVAVAALDSDCDSATNPFTGLVIGTCVRGCKSISIKRKKIAKANAAIICKYTDIATKTDPRIRIIRVRNAGPIGTYEAEIKDVDRTRIARGDRNVTTLEAITRYSGIECARSRISIEEEIVYEQLSVIG